LRSATAPFDEIGAHAVDCTHIGPWLMRWTNAPEPPSREAPDVHSLLARLRQTRVV